jgi:anthranilate synthase component 1
MEGVKSELHLLENLIKNQNTPVYPLKKMGRKPLILRMKNILNW